MRLLVGLPRLVELALVLVADGEIVERGGVGRVDLDRLLPAVDGLAPEPPLRDVDAELDLRAARRLARRRCAGADARDDEQQARDDRSAS